MTHILLRATIACMNSKNLTTAAALLYVCEGTKERLDKRNGRYIYSIELTNSSLAFSAATSFTGFSLFPASGTITGTVRVYGLANS